MAKPTEKAYCEKCNQQRTFIHKSVMKGYECAKCGTPYKLPSAAKGKSDKPDNDRTHTIIFKN